MLVNRSGSLGFWIIEGYDFFLRVKGYTNVSRNLRACEVWARAEAISSRIGGVYCIDNPIVEHIKRIGGSTHGLALPHHEKPRDKEDRMMANNAEMEDSHLFFGGQGGRYGSKLGIWQSRRRRRPPSNFFFGGCLRFCPYFRPLTHILIFSRDSMNLRGKD
jgi:hypothetical protein